MNEAAARQQQRASRVVWFEIPTTNLERATRFYNQILDITMTRQADGPFSNMALFPYSPPAIGGCVTQGRTPTQPGAGSIVYLNADPSLDAVLDRVEPAGGKILAPRTALPEGMGYFAEITDLDGNVVGLHAVK
jgi:predicted enzyme related to lactoylglutathione lyase